MPLSAGMLHATSFRLLGHTTGKLHGSCCKRLATVPLFCRQTESPLDDRRQSHLAASSRQSQLVSEDAQAPASAYVHLPFCKRRCYYCDFPVSVVGSRPEQPGIQQGMQDYINILCKEIEATVKVPGPPLQTIFFGGGTPTLVPPNLLQQILRVLDAKYGIARDAEISMESDPGTFDTNRLLEYISLGVNRFSMGVQCFQQNLLELCGRSHSLSDVYQAIDDIHQAGVQNWSLDLISGLPQLTSKDWQQSLQNAISANPAHISVYDLQVSCVMLTRVCCTSMHCDNHRPLVQETLHTFRYIHLSLELRMHDCCLKGQLCRLCTPCCCVHCCVIYTHLQYSQLHHAGRD